MKLESGGSIEDEYGRAVTVEAFKDMVELKAHAPLNHAKQYPGEMTFLDPEGHAFAAQEFT